MAQFIDAGGEIITQVLNTGYNGPLKIKSYIQDFFFEAENRERVLDELYKADREYQMKEHKKPLKSCHDLLKYALPEQYIFYLPVEPSH